MLSIVHRLAAHLLFAMLVSATASLALDPSRLPAAASRGVDFEKDIRPIFEQSCVKCHGPEKQKGGWRADVKELALKAGDNYAPSIVPGKSADSPLIHFVAGLEEDMLMPAKGDPLSAEQIGVLRAWIDQGANWPEGGLTIADPTKTHWAFQPLNRPPIPQNTGGNPLDAFVVTKLTEKGLALSPEADRGTLIRRLSFDLNGLPPSPQEVADFVADPDPHAYEKLVERLLSSPRYGERWARHWLDVVRFAESDGFEMNSTRPNAWRYRDYVIRAFNEDKPYDQFIREQLAGDALGADEATGFLVGGPVDLVKSPDPVLTAQQRADELHDIVSTTGSAMLGLSVGCARCHNHKFDPISQADYYALTAVFQGVRHGERPMRPSDYKARLAQADALREQLAPISAKLATFQPKANQARVLLLDDSAEPSANAARPGVTQIERPKNEQPITYSDGKERGQAEDPGDLERLPNLGQSYRYWIAEAGKRKDLFSWDPKLAGRFRVWLSWGAWTTHAKDVRYIFDRDGDLSTTSDQAEIARVDQSTFADGSPTIAEQKRWSGLFNAGVHELARESRIVLRSGDKGEPVAADAMLFEEVADEAAADPAVSVPHLRAPVTHRVNEEVFEPVEAKFVRFSITASSSAQPCLDELEVFTAGATPRNVALASAGAKPAASGIFSGGANPKHQLAHLNDGRYGNDFSWISNENGAGWAQVEFAKPERIQRVIWSRDRSDGKRAFDDRVPTDYRIEVSLDGQEWRAVASSTDRLGAEYRKRVAEVPTLGSLSATQMAEARGLTARRAQIEKQITTLTTVPPAYAGKFEQPGPTYRLHRGEPMQKREEVAPAALPAFGPPLNLAADTPEQQRRVALADWIADPKNPLTTRVLVNRIWHYHFGAGLVDTPSDFGINGGQPTHPELLDWLAGEFIARGWRMKELHRLIVLSRTYRQSGKPNAAALRVDGGSRLLWRFPPRRLEAEPLRDTILAVSGQLDLRMGGPGFDIFEPNSNYVKVYRTKEKFGPAEFRRMIYQEKPRVQLDDVFGVFDCPDAGQIAPRRTSSTTPIQALSLLNSAFVFEQASFFAARLEREAPADAAAQARRAFLLAFGREPLAEETADATALIREHGLTIFCRALYNANEFINVY